MFIRDTIGQSESDEMLLLPKSYMATVHSISSWLYISETGTKQPYLTSI